jgi:HlyD family secretion protein
VETLVDETNISNIAVGNPAQITIDSLPDVVLTGKVGRIKRIGTTVNGLVKYTVVVLVDPTDKPVLFGATVSVTITTGDPHPMLAVPVSAVQTDAQGEYVTLVKAGGSTQRLTVVSGDLIDNLVTITTTEALKEGDQVQLGTASSSTSGNNNSNPGSGMPDPGAGGPPGG